MHPLEVWILRCRYVSLLKALSCAAVCTPTVQAELVKLCDQVEAGTIKTELDPAGDGLGGIMEPYGESVVPREAHPDDLMSLLLKVWRDA